MALFVLSSGAARAGIVAPDRLGSPVCLGYSGAHACCGQMAPQRRVDRSRPPVSRPRSRCRAGRSPCSRSFAPRSTTRRSAMAVAHRNSPSPSGFSSTMWSARTSQTHPTAWLNCASAALTPVVVGQSPGVGTSALKRSAARGEVVARRNGAHRAWPPLPAGRILNVVSFVGSRQGTRCEVTSPMIGSSYPRIVAGVNGGIASAPE